VELSLNNGPVVEPASNGNKYQEYSVGDKGGRYVGLTTLTTSCADCLEIWELHPPGTPRACRNGIALSFSKCNRHLWEHLEMAHARPEYASQGTVLQIGLFTSELSYSHDVVQWRCHANSTERCQVQNQTFLHTPRADNPDMISSQHKEGENTPPHVAVDGRRSQSTPHSLINRTRR